MEIKELTSAEEKIMVKLWKLEKAFVKEILKEMAIPKPAYNTVSTIIRILEKKGFVEHEFFGGSHQYYPIISKTDYTRFATQRLLEKYFDGSAKKLMTFVIDKLRINSTSLADHTQFKIELNNKQ